MAIDLSKLTNKVNNNGEDDNGVLTAEEFVKLVNAVQENQQAVNGVVKTIQFGGGDVLKPVNGHVVIPADTGDLYKFSLISPSTDYESYNEYINSFPQIITKGDGYIVEVKVNFEEQDSDKYYAIKDALNINFKVGNAVVGTSKIYDADIADLSISESNKIVSFNYANYLAANTYNEISFDIIDTKGRIPTKTVSFNNVFVVNATISLELAGTINGLNIFNSSSIDAENTGAKIVVKTSVTPVTVKLYNENDQLLKTISMSDTTTQLNFNNEDFKLLHEHGNHTIYANLDYNVLNSTISIRSNEVSFIFYDDRLADITEPLTSINKKTTDVLVKEYSQVIFEYLIYLPENYNTETQSRNIEVLTRKQGDSNIVISKSFPIVPETITDRILTGNISYSLTHNDKASRLDNATYIITTNFGSGENKFTKDFVISIEQSPINLESYNFLSEKLFVYLKSADKTTDDKTWSYTYTDVNNSNITTTYDVKFNNFDFTEVGSTFYNDTTIDGGQTVLRIKRNSSLDIPYSIFAKKLALESANNEGETGKTISINFKTYNCISQVEPIITCLDTSVPEDKQVGFIVYPNKIVVKSKISTYEAKFKEDERIHLDIVIEGTETLYHNPTVSGTKGEEVDDKPSSEALVIIYVNGVYQRLHRITSINDVFSTYDKDGRAVVNNSQIRIGGVACDIDLYSVRLYEQALSPKQIVFNYGYDNPYFDEKINIIYRNDIWTEDKNPISKLYDISETALREHLPELPVFTFIMHNNHNNELPADKKNWKYLTKSDYHNKLIEKGTENTGNVSWKQFAAGFRNQGTSSMNYPMPWRNWDWKADKKLGKELGFESGNANASFFDYTGLNVLGDSGLWKQYDNMPQGIKKITFKKDFASSEMCNNAICSSLYTDMAIIAKDVYPNVAKPTGNLAKNGFRLSLKAIPCFMYQELSREDENSQRQTKTLGMMNLIPNKNEVGYLGFDLDETNTWNSVKILQVKDSDLYNNSIENKIPRPQAWEVSENHVIWDKYYESYTINQVLIGNDNSFGTERKYPNIVVLNDGLTINESILISDDDDAIDAHKLDILNYIYNIDSINKTYSDVISISPETITLYDYYIMYNSNNEQIFVKVIDKNADEPEKPQKLDIELYGTYINGVLNNYEARYPKDSTGCEFGSDEINIWGKDIEADFGFAPDSDWKFSKNTFEYVGDDEKVHTFTQQDIINIETRDILRLHNWFVDCHPANVVAGNKIFINGVETDDTVANRQAKFKAEAEDYLIVDQWILYYLWRELFWMFDSGSKNLQLYTIDGMHWGCMVRDADTALGIDNLGVETFPPYLEDTDYYTATKTFNFYFDKVKDIYKLSDVKHNEEGVDAKAVLNGQFGSIWLNIRDCYKTEIAAMAGVIYESAANKLTAKALIDEFDNHQNKWCESLYNFGMRQYFGGPLFYKWITSGNGNKRLSRKDWLSKAFDYRLSKYKAYGSDETKYFNWRATKLEAENANGILSELQLKFYQPCYIASGGASSGHHNTSSKCYKRITDFGDTVVTLPITGWGYPEDGKSESNSYFYGAHNITDLGPLYKTVSLADFNPNKALTKVTKLELGNKDWSKMYGVYYSALKVLSLNYMEKLQHLDITNYNNVTSLQINECKQLETLYMGGTDALSEVILPQTITLREIIFGGDIVTLDLSNLIGLNKIEFDKTTLYNLSSFTAKNVNDYIKKESYKIIKKAPNLTTCDIEIDWTDEIISLDEFMSYIDKGFKFTGKVQLSSLDYQSKYKLMNLFGDIDNENNSRNSLYVKYDSVSIDGISMIDNIYIGSTGTHQLMFNVNNVNGNDFTAFNWTIGSISNNTTPGEVASINNKGILTVYKLGNEYPENERLQIEVKCIVTCKKYGVISTLEARSIVHLYERKANIGDIVYSDGSYGPVNEYNKDITSKDPIGICFYTDDDVRLMCSLTALKAGSRYINFGPYMNQNINIESVKNRLLYNNIYMLNDAIPYNPLNIIRKTYDRLDDDALIKIYSGVPEFAKHNSSETMYSIGICKDDFNGIQYNEPFGKVFTKHLIDKRDSILRVFEDAITNDADNFKSSIGAKNYPSDGYLVNNTSELTWLERRLDDTDGVGDDYGYINMFYYPVASYCYAYQPSVRQGVILSDKFKSHNWWLPSIAEMYRILVYIGAASDKRNNEYGSLFFEDENTAKYFHQFDALYSTNNTVSFNKFDNVLNCINSFYTSSESYTGEYTLNADGLMVSDKTNAVVNIDEIVAGYLSKHDGKTAGNACVFTTDKKSNDHRYILPVCQF